jgi:hypothetical protein
LAITDHLLARNAETTKAMGGSKLQFKEFIGNRLEEWWRILESSKEWRSVGSCWLV